MCASTDLFDFDKDIILEDENVLLRPLAKTDFEYLISYAQQEPELWQHAPVSAAGGKGLTDYIEIALNSRAAKQAYPFIVWDKRKKQYAGSTRFYEVRLKNKTLSLGYTWYGKAFQGSGINTHCKFLLLSYAFEVMEVERVEFRADYANSRSVAAMKSIGCVQEGILRSETLLASGKRRNTVVLSILKEEWFQTVKNLLETKMNK